ncbi:MAG TPA: hypothetical protein PKM76_06545, partial [Bacteroidales bacterium]|nr:hypothetical protein [Bacteroidales bacterium]
MESVIEKCESTISELLKFSRSVLYLGKPIKDKRFIKFENEIGYELSIDFKYILERYNGFSLLGSRVFGLDSEYQESSLDRIYHFEHNIVENKMPS